MWKGPTFGSTQISLRGRRRLKMKRSSRLFRLSSNAVISQNFLGYPFTLFILWFRCHFLANEKSDRSSSHVRFLRKTSKIKTDPQSWNWPTSAEHQIYWEIQNNAWRNLPEKTEKKKTKKTSSSFTKENWANMNFLFFLVTLWTALKFLLLCNVLGLPFRAILLFLFCSFQVLCNDVL